MSELQEKEVAHSLLDSGKESFIRCLSPEKNRRLPACGGPDHYPAFPRATGKDEPRHRSGGEKLCIPLTLHVQKMSALYSQDNFMKS